MNPPGWITIEGYEGMYSVNELGQVFSRRTNKILRPGIASNGYPTVALGRGNTRTLHSLVAEAFIGPRPENMDVRHKDGNRLNPRADNLEHGTRTENILDSIRHQQWMSEKRCAQIEALKKLTPENKTFIAENLGALSYRATGRRLGVQHGTISRYVAGLGRSQ